MAVMSGCRPQMLLWCGSWLLDVILATTIWGLHATCHSWSRRSLECWYILYSACWPCIRRVDTVVVCVPASLARVAPVKAASLARVAPIEACVVAIRSRSGGMNFGWMLKRWVGWLQHSCAEGCTH
jgi:hypothetical protein